jgi:hypothetical protein
LERWAGCALATLCLLSAGACVIGPKPDDPLKTGGEDAGFDSGIVMGGDTGVSGAVDASADAIPSDTASGGGGETTDPNVTDCDGDASPGDGDADAADARHGCGDAAADTLEAGADAPTSG